MTALFYMFPFSLPSLLLFPGHQEMSLTTMLSFPTAMDRNHDQNTRSLLSYIFQTICHRDETVMQPVGCGDRTNPLLQLSSLHSVLHHRGHMNEHLKCSQTPPSLTPLLFCLVFSEEKNVLPEGQKDIFFCGGHSSPLEQGVLERLPNLSKFVMLTIILCSLKHSWSPSSIMVLR